MTEVQDAIAARLLAESADEQVWAASFQATKESQWDSWADAIRRDIAAGDTLPLEDLLPPDVSGT